MGFIFIYGVILGFILGAIVMYSIMRLRNKKNNNKKK
jgi:ABC-type lipoprotein release transport system permease subunit